MYGYPWVFNEAGFTGSFKESVHSVTSRLIRLKARQSNRKSLGALTAMKYKSYGRVERATTNPPDRLSRLITSTSLTKNIVEEPPFRT